MASTRMRGNALALTLGSPGTNYWADAISVELLNEEKDGSVVTFEDAANYGEQRQWYFTITAIQSTTPSSFWRYLWANTGEVVAFTFAPHGNTTATDDQPHFLGTCKIGPKPAIGGEASHEDTPYRFETRLDVETGPTMDTGVEP